MRIGIRCYIYKYTNLIVCVKIDRVSSWFSLSTSLRLLTLTMAKGQATSVWEPKKSFNELQMASPKCLD